MLRREGRCCMIYFDQAATTKPYDEVVEIANQYLTKRWYNPSSAYQNAGLVKNAIENARIIIAETLNAEPDEIIFTSGSTEAINWFTRNMGNHPLYISEIEHPAVINSAINPVYVSLDKNKCVNPADVPRFGIALLAYINNEIGSILPIPELINQGAIPLIDATQAYGHIPIDVKELGIDYLIASGHKFHGIKGSGFLYISREMLKTTKKYKMQAGGGQEQGFRAGTENVIGIITMAHAAMISLHNRKEKNRKIEQIRNYLYGTITNNIPCAHLNGTANWEKRWCGNLNFRFDGYRGEELLAWFDSNDICVSTGSACSSHENKPSHVLKAIGLTDEEADSSIRFSFDETNTLDEAKEVYRVLTEGLKVLNHD